MYYTEQELKDKIERFGEVSAVLDSGREYQIHGMESVEFYTSKKAGQGHKEARVEGLKGDEWIIAEFPLDRIEHVYTHREV